MSDTYTPRAVPDPHAPGGSQYRTSEQVRYVETMANGESSVPPPSEEPLPEDATVLAQRVVDLEKQLDRDAERIVDLQRWNANQYNRIQRLRAENASLKKAQSEFCNPEWLTSQLDALDAYASKRKAEAETALDPESVTLTVDQLFSRYRKAVEAQVLAKAVKDLRAAMPKRAPRVWQSSDEPEPPVGTHANNRFGDEWHRRENGWHAAGCGPNCHTGDRWTSPTLHFPLTEVVD